MNKLEKTFKKISSAVKDEENVFTITHKGQGISLNQFYDSRHWTARNKLKQKYRPHFKKLADDVLQGRKLDEYGLVLYYNSRHDVDNTVGTEKMFVDALCETHGGCVVKDDSKNYFKFLAIIPDRKLPNNTFEFHLISLK